MVLDGLMTARGTRRLYAAKKTVSIVNPPMRNVLERLANHVSIAPLVENDRMEESKSVLGGGHSSTCKSHPPNTIFVANLREFPSTRRIGSTMKQINPLIQTTSLIKLLPVLFIKVKKREFIRWAKCARDFYFIKKINKYFHVCMYKSFVDVMSYLKCMQISRYKCDRRKWGTLTLALCRDSILTTPDSVEPSFAIPIIRPFLTSNPLLSPFVLLRRVMQLRLLFEWTIKRPRGAPPIIQFLFNRLLYSCTRARAAASSRDPFFLLRIIQKERRRKSERKKQKRGSAHRWIKREWANAHGVARGEGGTMCGPAIIVAFPTDKVTTPEYFLFSAADRARITRKES